MSNPAGRNRHDAWRCPLCHGARRSAVHRRCRDGLPLDALVELREPYDRVTADDVYAAPDYRANAARRRDGRAKVPHAPRSHGKAL